MSLFLAFSLLCGDLNPLPEVNVAKDEQEILHYGKILEYYSETERAILEKEIALQESNGDTLSKNPDVEFMISSIKPVLYSSRVLVLALSGRKEEAIGWATFVIKLTKEVELDGYHPIFVALSYSLQVCRHFAQEECYNEHLEILKGFTHKFPLALKMVYCLENDKPRLDDLPELINVTTQKNPLKRPSTTPTQEDSNKKRKLHISELLSDNSQYPFSVQQQVFNQTPQGTLPSYRASLYDDLENGGAPVVGVSLNNCSMIRSSQQSAYNLLGNSVTDVNEKSVYARNNEVKVPHLSLTHSLNMNDFSSTNGDGVLFTDNSIVE